MSLRLEHSIHVSVLSAKHLYNVCLYTIFGVTLVAIALLAIFSELSALSNSQNNWLIVLFGLSLAVNSASVLHLNFQRRFRTIAILNLLIPTVFIAGTLTVETPWEPANPLLFWQAIAYAASACLSVLVQRSSLIKPSIRDVLKALKLERGNWQYLVPSSILSILSLNMSVIGATALFDTSVAGLIVIAQRIARAPVSVIGNGLNEVLRASIPNRSHILSTFRIIASISIGMALAMTSFVYLTPEKIYSFILGEGWDGIKSVLIITIIGASLQLIGTSVISLLTSFKKRTDLQINFCLFVCGAFALLATKMFKLDIYAYLWLHTLLIASIYLAGFMIAYRIAKDETK